MEEQQAAVLAVYVSAKKVAEKLLVQGGTDLNEPQTCSSDAFVRSSQGSRAKKMAKSLFRLRTEVPEEDKNGINT